MTRPSRGLTGGASILALAAVVLCLPVPAGAEALRAEAVLPPGNSGYVSITGLPSGTGSPHLTDQNQLFIDFELRPFGFARSEQTAAPAPGVTISRDSFGVPRIDADSDRGAWLGVGYAAAEDRLFQLELFRRAGAGRLAEILGSGYLDDDLVARRDYYTDAELDRMIARIPAHLRERLVAYRDGINAYIDHLRTRPTEIPGEFVALGVPLRDWTVRDSARIGVLLARTVPSGDGNELANARALKKIGGRSFNLLHPVRTPGRIPTVKRSEGVFKAQPGRSRKDEKVGFRRTRRWLRNVDLDASGPGTTAADGGPSALSARQAERAGEDLRRIIPSGGSFMWAISDRKRKRGYLFNGPQLGWTIPELFWEFELHSPEQDIRGVSAAGVPLVGIGHNGRVAWGFTSGLSDEDDLFAVRTGPEGENYRFRGRQEQMECRNEVFVYNTPPTDLPGLIDDPGLPAGTRTERICRTRHGPVQLRGDGVAFARRYAIWERELETIVGLTDLNDARNIDDVDRAMRRVTWNENVMATDSRGRIGFWHPGLHPLRAKRWDERLPTPGDGRGEWRGLLPRSKTPRVVNPRRGWLTNWNNPPSVGWTNGDGPARERLSGNLHRVRLIQKLTRQVARNPSYARSRAIELESGTTAQQFPFADRRKLRAAQRLSRGIDKRALRVLRRWDGSYARTDGAGTIDPGVSIWEQLKDELETTLLRRHGGEAARPLAGGRGSSHAYDITNGAAIALRELGPQAYARAASRAATKLRERFETPRVRSWRAPRLMYDVGAQGAGSAPELPFFDRGTWSQSLAMG